MNEFFVEKIQKHVSNLGPPPRNTHNKIRELMKDKLCALNFSAVYPDDVEKIISSIKSKSSCGLDNIDARILKLGRHYLVPAITHIINLSISTQTFPEEWKKAKVIPLHKKNDKISPENYRPVSLLSSVSKVCEKAFLCR